MDERALLLELLRCPSLSGEEGPFASVLAALFKDDGYQVTIDEHANLFARVEGEPLSCLFSTHIDTVPPYFEPREDCDTIYGRGACDTKGGLVAMITAARRLRSQGYKGIGFLLVVREETDHLGARVSAETIAIDGPRPRIILCEPTCNRLVRAQKGMLKLRLKARGAAAHSAYPELGSSAIHDLIDALARIRDHAWTVDPILGPTTWNAGLISGGVAANVTAPEAEATLVFRLAEPLENTRAALDALLPDSVRAETIAANDPVIFDPPDDIETCVVAFNTDASYLSRLGDIWLIGPGDIGVAHSDHEHIRLADLREGIELYTRLGRIALEA